MNYASIASNITSALTSFESLTQELNSISFGSVWSGDAYNTQSKNLEKTIRKINSEITFIKSFTNALNKLQRYKDNKESIEGLRNEYNSLSNTPENSNARSNLSSRISELESTNSDLKFEINSILSIIGSLTSEVETVTYEPEKEYQNYADQIADLYNWNEQGKLSIINDSFYNHVNQEQLTSTLDDIKSQYTGRNAAVNCAVGLMHMAAEVGKKISYNAEYKSNTAHYSTHNPETFPLSEVINGTDCSSFVSWAVNQGANGSFTTKSTQDFKTVGSEIKFSNARPGDIIVSNNSHVGLIVENHPDEGYFLVAEEGGSEHGLVVQKRKYSSLDNFKARDLSYVYGEVYNA